MKAPRNLDLLVAAETRKLASRLSARLSLAAMVVVGVLVPVIMLVVSDALAIDPADLPPNADPEAFKITLGGALSTVLGVRNFFVFRAAIIAVVAVSVAGEFVDRTLREDLVRPVPRWAVLTAKWAALQVFVFLGAALPYLFGGLVGLACFGTGDVAVATTQYALTWLGDAGFATLVMAISLALRSVPGTIGGVFLYWVIDRALGFVLWAIESGRGLIEAMLEQMSMQDLTWMLDAVERARPWLPSSAFDLYWDYDPEGAWVWQSFVAWGVYTAAAYAVGLLVLTRLDVD